MKRKLSLGDYFELAKVLLIPIFIILFLNTKFFVEDFPLYAILVFLLAFSCGILGFMFSKNKIRRTKLSRIIALASNFVFQISILGVFLHEEIVPTYIFTIFVVLNVLIIAQQILFEKFNFSYVLNTLLSYANILFCFAIFACFYHTIFSPTCLYLLLAVAGIYFVLLACGFVFGIKITTKRF